MAYVSDGQALGGAPRSSWGFSFLVKKFWGAVEFIGWYFQTLVQPHMNTTKVTAGSSRFSDGRHTSAGRLRMGRINHGGGPNAPPMGGG